jgi:superfamily I DNA and RNA helicase
MREEKMKETLEPADFSIEISATSDQQKPKVTIWLAADNSMQTEVTKYRNLQQLTEALVKLGEDRRSVENDLKRINTAYASVEGVAMAGEPAGYTPNITIAQARDFGWED